MSDWKKRNEDWRDEDELEEEEECECPWVDSKGKVRETAYCQYLLEKHPMMCLKQKLFDQNGEVDEDALLYAHTQNKPRLELTEKIEADFYTQDVAGAKPQEPPENKTPVATKITGKMILEAIRQMDAEERRELTRVLFA